MFSPLVMEMQTGIPNAHISHIFFLLVAQMYWLDWLVAIVLMMSYKGACHVSSTSPNRHFDYYLLGLE
jgi:hypothetical protein